MNAQIKQNLAISGTIYEQVRHQLMLYFRRQNLGGKEVTFKERYAGKNVIAFDTDLGVAHVFWRWRSYDKYDPKVFTVRSKARRAKYNELESIKKGEFDLYFYCQLDPQNETIVDWMLVKVSELRRRYLRDQAHFDAMEQENSWDFRDDGTAYIPFPVDQLGPGIVMCMKEVHDWFVAHPDAWGPEGLC